MKKRSIIFPVMILSSLILTSCNNQPTPEPVVEVISLKEIVVIPPNKLEYRVNQELDLSGMVVKAIFSDGTVTDLKENEYKVEGFDSDTPGQCTVNVSYSKDGVSKSSSFVVSILEDEYVPMSLYQSDSRLYLTSTEEKGAYPLKTYRHKEFGDTPYVEMGELLISLIPFLEYTRDLQQVGKGVYKFVRPSGDKNGSILFDVNEQKITITNAAGIYTDVFGDNNGFGDFAAGAKIIRGSSKTKIVKEGKPRVIDLKAYGYRIEEQENRLYIPASLASGLLFTPATSGLTYNGHDYFVRQSLENINIFPLAFSSKEGFAMVSTGGTQKQLYKPVALKADTEAYRYQAKLNVSSAENPMVDLVLNKDGTGTAKSTDNPLFPAVDMAIKWSKDGDIITMDLDRLMGGDSLGEIRRVRIRTDESSYFGQTKRSETLAQDNYRGICFALDLNFGLKGFKEITTFDEYFTAKGRKEALLSTDPETYQDAVARFIFTDFDEMHSNAIDQSYFGDFDELAYFSAKGQGSGDVKGYQGERTQKFYSELIRLKQIYDKSENARETYEVYQNTAVLKFDTFYYRDSLAYNDTSYQTETYEKAQQSYYKAWSNNDTYKAFAIAFNDIQKNENIKNIVIDVAMNTGGEVRVMPLLSAFYNKDPNIIVKNNIDDSIIDLHYEADLDGDGTYASDTDTFENKYNFYFLTGGVSFSCGNAFPTMAKNSKKAKVIGELSAGGSCMVTAFVTMDGLTFNTSSPYQFMLDNFDGTYVYNENGVPLDNQLDLADGFNMAKLTTFINNLNSGN